MNGQTHSTLDPLKLRHLRFLLTLAEERNLGRAAQRMAMTQPAASRLLSELELRFHSSLFDRGRHGMRPLPEAAAVLRFAAMVCAEEQLVMAQLAKGGARAADLRLGTLPTVPALVIQAVHACKRDTPQGNVSLRQGTLDALLPSLLNGDLDVVIGRFDPALAHDPLRYRRLIEEPLAVVASVGHPLLRRRRITPAELREQPWVAPVRTSSQFPSFAELFGGLPLPDDLIECASPVATHSLLQDGRRVGLLAVSTLSQPWGHGLKRLPVEVRWQPGPMGLYTVEGRFVAPEVEAFCRHIVKLAIHPRGA